MLKYKHTLATAWTLAVGLSAPGVIAQTHPAKVDTRPITLIGPSATAHGAGTDSSVIYRILVENAPQAYNIPGAPRFAIIGKDHRFYLGIGGTAKATLSYDFGHVIDNGFDFATSSIPMTQAPGNGGKIQISAATSSLYLNFVALPGTDNRIGVYVNANFTGDNYTPDLQYAYLKYRGITAGYNYSLFSDIAAAPPSIDNEGPPGLVAVPNGVIDYTHGFGKHWGIGVGLEMPMLSATMGNHTASVNQRIPDLPAYIQYSWDATDRLRLSGIIRTLQYRDLLAGRNRTEPGWGVKISGTVTPVPAVTCYCQAAYGKGLSSYFIDLDEGGLDLVPAGTPGHLTPVEAWGGYVGIQYNLTRNLMATTTYSHLRNYADRYTDGSVPWSSQYKYAQYALANILWTPVPYVQCGLEYIYGRRVNMDGTQAHDSRLQTMIQVAF